MKVEQLLLTPGSGWSHRTGSLDSSRPQFVLVFGERALLDEVNLSPLRRRYPAARLVFCSTAGEIVGTEVTEGRACATAVAFERSEVCFASTTIDHADESRARGAELGRALRRPDLVHVFTLCDGSLTNGTEFAAGLASELPEHVRITGGLAGDGARFEQTVVGLDQLGAGHHLVALGFCGPHIVADYGCEGGWAPFGPERIVTRSEGNRLYELDGRSALALYKNYLGEQARGLPGSALRFPLSVHPPGGGFPLVRTILAIDDAADAMVFAGDIPSGSRVRMMRASQEDLIDGAAKAASHVQERGAELILCVSCVGRRLVLGQRIEEETELVRDTLGGQPVMTGFYSYGELAPSAAGGSCQLHNQTMTLTVLRES